ncbi:MAG: calcium-translocating P-type ATPase, PMCA-type, partial [SAR324 cluster bacterium]|nr:calcium-translocating P-type ATPase, PMCA-type [SAR324 cluster bacterium]
ANILEPPHRESWWKLYLEKYNDPIIRILIVAAFIAIATGIVDGHYIEGVGIVIAIFLATTLSFLNEYKANQEFDILNKVNDEVPIKVIRDGNFQTIPRKDLVVDDILLIEAGEEIPGDGQVLESVSLQVDESRLTGESVPVTKSVKSPAAKDTEHASAYPADKVLRGTIAKDGYGYICISAVGEASEIGTAARAASEDTTEETPLAKQLNKLSKVIGIIGFSVAGLIYAALVVRGSMIDELVLNAQQWSFFILMVVSVLIAISRVWIPVGYDAMELMGKVVVRPEWLEKEGWQQWLKVCVGGGLFFAVGMGVGSSLGMMPGFSEEWLPPYASSEFLKYFMISVTIIVVAVPEGLAMSVTLSLAYSMRKMTASNSLVRRMHACETIGAATVICSDKTGTLTQNEMQVFDTRFSCLSSDLSNQLTLPHEQLIVEAICANTTAQLSRTPGESAKPLGNPTEGSLLLWLDKLGIDYQTYRDVFTIQKQWTFTTERKFMGTLGASSATKGTMLHLKGAPEIVMARCSHILVEQERQSIEAFRASLERELKDYQVRGMRTLALACKESPVVEEGGKLEDAAIEMTWLGFIAIADPIRVDVPDAIASCQNAGIKVKIVTGDIAETAKEIARQIGLGKPEDGPECYLTGPEFGAMSDSQALQSAMDLKVLARARPLDKLRLVRLLQTEDQVVAVTGDGTNDAPALNHANVGLAMGKTGTAVAKEASDIILLDDSFPTIVNAVMWGRSLYENIQRFVLFQLTINLTALGIAFIGPFIGIKLPLTVIQMLWVNLIMDTFAAFALATEPPHHTVMNRMPRHPQDFIVSKNMAKQIFAIGAIFLVFLIGVLRYLQQDGQVTDYELSLFFSIFVMLQFWNLFNARCLGQVHSAFSGLFTNRAFLLVLLVILVGQVMIVQLGGSMFRTTPLTLSHWVYLILGTSLVLWIGEISRFYGRLKSKHAPSLGELKT